MGKNTGKNFSEGWVEFEDKKVAKQVAAMLNNNPMGGNRRSAYHYDLWCMKYLSKFKWDHLTEEIGEQHLAQSTQQSFPFSLPQMIFARDHGRSRPLERG